MEHHDPACNTTPPHEDWLHTSRSGILTLVDEFHNLCKGRGHAQIPSAPTLTLRDGEQFVDRARRIIEWCTQMLGHQSSDSFFDERRSQSVSMNRYKYFWTLYREFTRHATSDDAAENQRGNSPDGIHIPKMSLVFEVLRRIDTISTHIYELSRFFEHDMDAAIPQEVSAGLFHKSLIRLWNQDVEAKPKSDFEELVLYILECACSHKFRKKGDVVYEEKTLIIGTAKVGTYAWQPAELNTTRTGEEESSIKTMVLRFCRKEIREDMWSRYVNLKSPQRLFAYLEECEDVEFPMLTTSRSVFSFNNGILDAAAGYSGEFYLWENAHEFVSANVVAAKFISLDVDPEWFVIASNRSSGWFDIETPLFQSILDYQNTGQTSKRKSEALHTTLNLKTCEEIQEELYKFVDHLENRIVSVKRQRIDQAPERLKELVSEVDDFQRSIKDICDKQIEKLESAEAATTSSNDESRSAMNSLPVEAQHWMYILLGRLLHNLGTFEKWQVVPFLRGAAGTGKSTIGQIIKNVYDPADVGILSNNIERKFGLQNLINKFMFICLELKKNIQLDQAEFQSMVSGEDISVPRKHGTALSVQWNIPGLLCGNEPPAWADSQGSLARRLVVFNFVHKINENDSNPDLLNDILVKEFAALLVKCNFAYRDMANRSAKMDIWRLLPSYFSEERRALARISDPVLATIYDETVFELHSRIGGEYADFYITMEDFQNHYNKLYKAIKQVNLPEFLSTDKLSGAFSDAGLQLSLCSKRVDGVEKDDQFVLGIRHRGGGYAVQGSKSFTY